MFRLRHSSVSGFPLRALAVVCHALRPTPPSSNRTYAAQRPVSGSPGNSRLGHTQGVARFVKPKPRLLLHLSAQILSQSGKFSFLFDRFTFPVRPLRSTSITRLLHYYGPVRLPTRAANWVMSSPIALWLPPPPVGPPRFLDQSFSTRRPQPPRRARRLLSPVPSSSVLGFAQSGRLTTLDFCVTRPNRVRLRCGSHFCPLEALPGRITPSRARAATCQTGNLHGELLSFH